jgi:hypothetical protein
MPASAPLWQAIQPTPILDGQFAIRRAVEEAVGSLQEWQETQR